ncbi:MAG: hypothetical protein AAFO77_14300 [Pseudomonadota bacterium]
MTTLKQNSSHRHDIDYTIIKSNAAVERRMAIRELMNRVFRNAA